jgi:hypothetical protein
MSLLNHVTAHEPGYNLQNFSYRRFSFSKQFEPSAIPSENLLPQKEETAQNE